MSGAIEPVGLIGDPIGNVASEWQSLVPPSTAFEGQDWLGLSKAVGRAQGAASATFGDIDEYGRQVAPAEAPIAAADANKAYGIPGKLTFSAPLPASVAQSMHDAKTDEIAREDAAARAPSGFWPGAARMGAGFVAGLLDPLNVAAMFVPALGEARTAGMLARAGVTGLGADVLADVAEGGAAAIPSLGARTAVRAATGAVAGATFQAPLVALRYGLSKQEQGDYSAMDALGDVMTMGAGLGALGHVGTGALRDVFGARFRSSRAGAIVADDPATAEAAMRASVAQMVSGDPVEVDPVIYGVGGPEPGAAGAPVEGVTPGASPYDTLPKEPERLTNFLIRNGGLNDTGGDVRSIAGGPKERPGLLNSRTGSTNPLYRNGQMLDDATMRAWEAGYFPEHGENRPGINDLLEKLDEDLNRGRPQYSVHDQAAVENFQTAMAQNHEIDRLASEHGIDPANKTRAQFFDAVTEHLSQDDAAAAQAEADRAHEHAYGAFETRARERVEASGATWDPDEFHGSDQSRSLEDLENEHRQEDAAAATRERAGGDAESGTAGRSAGAGEEGGGHGGGVAGPSGRAGTQAGETGRSTGGIADPVRRQPVAEIRSDQIAAPGTPGRLRAVSQWAMRNLRRREVHSDALGADVTINRTGIDKALNRAGDDILSAVPAIPDLIARGERLGVPMPPRNAAEAVSTRAWHVLGGDVRIDGRDVPMFVHIREDRAGHFFYNLGRDERGGDPDSKAGDPVSGETNLSRVRPPPEGNVARSGENPSGELTAADVSGDAREETDGSGRALSESFDQAVRRAGGEASPDEAAAAGLADAAAAEVKPDPADSGIPAAIETQIADATDALARADAAGLIGASEHAEIEDAASWIERAKDYAQGVLQAAACIARGL